MSDESKNSFADHQGQGADFALREAQRPVIASPILKRMLGGIPPRGDDPVGEIGAQAAADAIKRSEARRDAVLAVALAIKRRGGNPLTDWTTTDIDTAYAMADQLIALG